MTTDSLIADDPADTSRPAFTFSIYLTPSTLPLAPTQRVIVLNDPSRLNDLVKFYPDGAYWGRAAFWKFVQSLRKDLSAAARAPAATEAGSPPGPAIDTSQGSPAPDALELEKAQADNRRLLADINNLKIEFGPAVVGLVTGDPLDWFRRVGAVPPRALVEAERPGRPTPEGKAPGE